MNQLKLALASVKAAIVSIVFVSVITVWADLAPGLKAWLAGLTGHHWVSKSLLSLGVYAVFFWMFYAKAGVNPEVKLKPVVWLLVASAAAGFIVLTGFFFIHYKLA